MNRASFLKSLMLLPFAVKATLSAKPSVNITITQPSDLWFAPPDDIPEPTSDFGYQVPAGHIVEWDAKEFDWRGVVGSGGIQN